MHLCKFESSRLHNGVTSCATACVCSVVDELGIPIKFVGVGETVDDLQPFDAGHFVDALFPSVEQAALAQ